MLLRSAVSIGPFMWSSELLGIPRQEVVVTGKANGCQSLRFYRQETRQGYPVWSL
jgi:hypothetical protein